MNWVNVQYKSNLRKYEKKDGMKAILYKAFLWQNEHTDICKNNKSISGIILSLLSIHGTISEKSEL